MTAPPGPPPAAPGPPPAAPGPPLPPRAVLAAVSALVVMVVLAAGAAVWALAGGPGGREKPNADPPAVDITPADVEPGAQAPAPAAQPVPVPASQGVPGGDAVTEWADRTARQIDVPARALHAYAATDLTMRSEAPACRLSWATLAGIGRLESNHGRFAGARLGPDGRPSRPIVGVPLDGSPGVRDIPDTDGGRLDGDATHDRAVGPLQFIPSTWARWAADGDGDQQADPHDLDDAALAAARYLCDRGRDTATPGGWWAAVLTYNNSVDYGRRVFGVADRYARSTAG